jgi:hypothetical protein
MRSDGVPFTVLYIMGLWRSGSTILDIILGNHEQLESVGELRNLPLEGWLGSEICSCGNPAASCERWRAVHDSWVDRVGGDKTARLVELQNRFERLRSIPQIVAASLFRPSRDFREYGKLLTSLYAAIAEVSGKSVIVDSTKYPGRAMALLRTRGIQVRLLHLVRDGRAVIWSYRRKPNVDFHGNVIDIDSDRLARWTTKQWLWVNALSELAVKMAGKKAVRIRYEDLVLHPERELARVGSKLDLDLRPVAELLQSAAPLHVGHMIAGNRVRHQGAVKLSPDLEWREKLPLEDRRAFWRRAGWLARRYGYVP